MYYIICYKLIIDKPYIQLECCNKSLVVTSSGGVASNKYQKNRTGVYYETRVENGHSVYQHENGKSYIIFHPKYGWRVR